MWTPDPTRISVQPRQCSHSKDLARRNPQVTAHLNRNGRFTVRADVALTGGLDFAMMRNTPAS